MEKNNFQKNWHWWVLGSIIVLAFFVRVYNFHDWLYFEADQVRNANNAIAAFENGPGELPLLGPKAGGTDLHLGPISYYFEYLSAIITQSTRPEVFAFPNLLFLLLLVPLTYYFLSHFFPKKISLLVVLVFSLSYMVTQYSRFSWNPNAILFWSLLFMLGLYKTYSEKETGKSGWWLLVMALSYAVASQLHMVALLGFPLIAIIFWIFYRPFHIKWAFWLASIALLFFFYTPVIVNDLNTSGSNTKNFLHSLGSRSEKRGLIESGIKTVDLHGKYYTFATLSLNEKEFKFSHWLGILFVIFGFTLIVLHWRGKIKLSKKLPRSFLILLSVWFGVYLLIYFRLVFDLDEPRFWFPTIFLAFILLAIIFSYLWKYRWGKPAVYVITILLVLLNLTAIANWYGGLKNQDEKNRFGRKPTSTTLIQNDFIALGDIEKAASLITESLSVGKACFNTPSTYLASYKFIFNRNHSEFETRRIDKSIEIGNVEGCDVFILDHSGNKKEEIEEKFLKKGAEIEIKKIGTQGLITIWGVNVIRNVNAENLELTQSDEDPDGIKKEKKPTKRPRLKWKDIFSKTGK